MVPAIGCNVGGSSCKIGVVDPAATRLKTATFAIPDTLDLETFTANLFERLDDFTSPLCHPWHRRPPSRIPEREPDRSPHNREPANARRRAARPVASASRTLPRAAALDIDRYGPRCIQPYFSRAVLPLLYSAGRRCGLGRAEWACGPSNGLCWRCCRSSGENATVQLGRNILADPAPHRPVASRSNRSDGIEITPPTCRGAGTVPADVCRRGQN